MRSFVATLCVLLATVAGVVAVPALWVAQHVADEDGFVASAQELTEDDAVRESTAELLADRLVESTGLPGAAADQVSVVIERAAGTALEGEDVASAWEESLRLTHRRALAERAAGEPLELEVAPLAALVAEPTGGLVRAPESLALELSGGPSPQVLDAVESSPRTGTAALVAVVVLALLALLVARRRGATLAALGAGALVVAAVVAVGSRAAWARAVEEASGLEATLTRRLGDVAQASLDRWLLVVAVGGAVVLVAGLVASAAGRGRS